MKQETYYVRVDERGNWTPNKYREVKADELDATVEKYAAKVFQEHPQRRRRRVIPQSCVS